MTSRKILVLAFPEVELVIGKRVKPDRVRNIADETLEAPGLTRQQTLLLKGDQLRIRLARFGEDDLLADMGAVEQLREMGLGVVNVDHLARIGVGHLFALSKT